MWVMNITNTRENTIIWFITVEVQVNGMIEITRLNECNGSNRFGSCTSCGKFSNDDKSMVRIKFMMEKQGTSVCLCSKCANVLFDTLKVKVVRNDSSICF